MDLAQLLKVLMQAQILAPTIVDIVEWVKGLMERAGEPVPSGAEYADLIDTEAAGNAAFTQDEVNYLKAKLVGEGG
jgi:hypothetical protein